jgi:hypothetical protein
MAGRQPDYNLSAMDKDSGDRNYQVGVAWKNPDGSINIKMNPCTKLEYDPGMMITLFPKDAPAKSVGKSKQSRNDDYDDDVPF